jgi:hypothetical protein
MQLNQLEGIPYGRDEDFVGREAIFQQVKEFETHRRLALIGLGGVGYKLPPSPYCFFVLMVTLGSLKLQSNMRIGFSMTSRRLRFSGFMQAPELDSSRPITISPCRLI